MRIRKISFSFLFLNFVLNHSEDKNMSTPFVSIILFTNRPGAIDMAFYSLAEQSSQDYELIVVDDSGGDRRSAMTAFADSLHINLQHVVRSKKKTSAVSAPGGEANAMNTGLLLARGRAAVFLNDFTWLPRSFVAETAKVTRPHRAIPTSPAKLTRSSSPLLSRIHPPTTSIPALTLLIHDGGGATAALPPAAAAAAAVLRGASAGPASLPV
jgi:hypothetical protein